MDLVFAYCTNIACTLVCLFFVRIIIIYLRIHNQKRTISRAKSQFAKVMIVLGSGGHTFEMLRLIKNLGSRFNPRIYVIADTDNLSEQKAISFEESSRNLSENFMIEKIPRSREVAQSWLSTIFTTLKASIISFKLVLKCKPDCLVCNGPGTCAPLCLSAFLLHVLGLKHIKVIYVESICRVHTMSLSGKILYHFTDYFLVQWPELRKKYPRSKYIGKLI